MAYSSNGGQTWTASVLDPGQFRSDPVLDFDADGNFYYSSLTFVNNQFQVDMFKSADGGTTWSNPPAFAFGGDKQWIAVDRTSGVGRGNVYQHWNEQFSMSPLTSFTRSVDGASSFEDATTGPDPFIKWGTMDVGPDGTLYAAGAELDADQGHLFSKSTNAQDPRKHLRFPFRKRSISAVRRRSSARSIRPDCWDKYKLPRTIRLPIRGATSMC